MEIKTTLIENKNQEVRIAYIDVIETLAMFFICFIHYPILRGNWWCNFVDCLGLAGVILFFMANGALLLNKDFNFRKHIKRILKMAGVLLLWELIHIIFFMNLYNFDYSTLTIGDSISYFLGKYSWNMPTGHFWFIRTCIALYIIFPIIKLVFDNKKYSSKILIWFITSIIIFNFLPNDFNTLQNFSANLLNLNFAKIDFSMLNRYSPINSDCTYHAIVFFILGGLLHREFYLENKTIKNGVYLEIGLILLGWLLLYLIKGIESDFTGYKFIEFQPYGRIAAIALGTGFFLLLKRTNKFKNKIVENISKNTLGIFYLHCLFLAALSKFYYPNISIEYYGVFLNTIKALIILFLCLGLTLFCKKMPYIKNLF